MSDGKQEIIRVEAAVKEGIELRLKGTRKRMTKMLASSSLKPNGPAHELVSKSSRRLQEALSLFETECKKHGSRHKAAARSIVAGIASCYTMIASLEDLFSENEATPAELARMAGLIDAKVKQTLSEISAVKVIGQIKELDEADKIIAAADAEADAAAKRVQAAAGDVWKHGKVQKDDLERDQKYNARRAAKEMENDTALKALFTKNTIHRSKLPSAKKDDDEFVLRQFPVVPIFDPLVHPKALRQAGFAVSSTEGFYNILDKQLLLGVNLEVIGEGKGAKVTDDMTPKEIRRANKLAETRVTNAVKQRIQEIVQIVEKRLGKKLHVAGSENDAAGVRIKGSDGFLWFWLLSNHEIDSLRKALGGRGVEIVEWGVAF